MSDEYEFYQGVVLRQLIVEADFSMMLRPFIKEGRINAFVLNGRIGVFIKHSAKRMSPWRFSFNVEQMSDLLDLTTAYSESFAIFVCGDDGMVALDVSSLYEILSSQESENAWIRIDRKPRSQYGVAGNKSELSHKVATGISIIIDTIRAQARAAKKQ